MPAHAKAPISHVILDANGKPGRTLTFQKGDYISDADLALLGDDHNPRLIVIDHNDHTCPAGCPSDSHSDRNAAAVAQPEAVAPAEASAQPVEEAH